MCVSVSSLSVYRFSARRKWLPIASLALGYIIIFATLGGCYAIASSRGHLNGVDTDPPAISMLGDLMPEHALFLVGFILLVICIGYCLIFRAGQIDEAHPGSIVNLVFTALALVGLVAIIVMAAIPTSSPLGDIHLGAAAVGMLLLALYGLVLSVTCLVWSCGTRQPDPKVPRALRLLCYFFTALASILGPVLFGVWITDVDRTPLEWAGVAFVFAAFLPMLVLFALHSARPDDDQERAPLVAASTPHQ